MGHVLSKNCITCLQNGFVVEVRFLTVLVKAQCCGGVHNICQCIKVASSKYDVRQCRPRAMSLRHIFFIQCRVDNDGSVEDRLG